MEHGKTKKNHPETRFRMRVSPTAVLLLGGTAAWAASGHGGTDCPAALAVLVLAALLHEMGHVVAARLCRVRISGMRLDLFGARLQLPGLLSYRQESAVALGGPAANLLTAAALLPAWMRCGCPLYGVTPELSGGGLVLGVLLPASLGLCAVNLLPVATLDGGRALCCLLSLWLGADAAGRILRFLSFLLLSALWLLSVYALLRAGQLLSLFVFSFCLLMRCMGCGVSNTRFQPRDLR